MIEKALSLIEMLSTNLKKKQIQKNSLVEPIIYSNPQKDTEMLPNVFTHDTLSVTPGLVIEFLDVWTQKVRTTNSCMIHTLLCIWVCLKMLG